MKSRDTSAIFIAAIVGFIVIFNTSIFQQSRRTTNDEIEKTPFTNYEMQYVLYGEGNASVSPKDPRYLNYLWSMMSRPSPGTKPNITKRYDDKLAKIVDERLRHRRNGFFIECGAHDGQFYSNTLFLEMERNWTGLLIEANRRLAKQLRQRNRQAYVFGGCLSPHRHSTTLPFKSADGQGGLRDHLGTLDTHITIFKSFESLDYVYCVPLEHLLLALGVNHVDFLSLDIQGAEEDILKTIDFSAVRIDVMLVEAASEAHVANITQFFKKTGIYHAAKRVAQWDLLVERIDLNTTS